MQAWDNLILEQIKYGIKRLPIIEPQLFTDTATVDDLLQRAHEWSGGNESEEKFILTIFARLILAQVTANNVLSMSRPEFDNLRGMLAWDSVTPIYVYSNWLIEDRAKTSNYNYTFAGASIDPSSLPPSSGEPRGLTDSTIKVDMTYMVTCPACDGSGKTLIPDDDPTQVVLDETWCAVCQGSGLVPTALCEEWLKAWRKQE